MFYRLSFAGMAAALCLSAASKPAQATFNRDVLPILQKNCQSCHRAGEAGPMSLMTYKEARPWAKAMRQAVLVGKMPPWFADPAHGKFLNDRRLAQKDVDTLVAWADRGAPEGNRKDAPKPVAFVDGWSLGQPDIVLEMPREFSVPATGTIEYQHFIVPTGFTEDRWITAAEMRPGNRAVTHHAVVFIRPPNSKWLPDIKPGEAYVPANWSAGLGLNEEVLDTYVPGAVPFRAREGQAKLIPAGSALILQMHYTANGKPAVDRSRIGLTFAKEPPAERLFSLQIANRRFTIPPGAAAHPVEGRMIFQTDTRIAGMMPHMHLRGRSMQYRAVFPTGETQTLLNVPKYDFNWQLFYLPAEQIVIPKGTRIEVSATFDNSPNNPRNPDASAEVKWGDQSWQEMMVGFIDVIIGPKTDPLDLLRVRRPASGGGE